MKTDLPTAENLSYVVWHLQQEADAVLRQIHLVYRYRARYRGCTRAEWTADIRARLSVIDSLMRRMRGSIATGSRIQEVVPAYTKLMSDFRDARKMVRDMQKELV